MTPEELRAHRWKLIRSYRRRLDEDFGGYIDNLLDDLTALDRKAALLAGPPEPDDKAITGGQSAEQLPGGTTSPAKTPGTRVHDELPKPPPAGKPAARRTPARKRTT
jgi:hypothetical protein